MNGKLAAIELVHLRACGKLGLESQRLLLAVSGGVDSMVLMELFARLGPELGVELAVAHVHHGLRGEAADADAAFVARQAESLGLTSLARRVDPAVLREDRVSRDRPTVQEAARQLRRRALIEMAEEFGAKTIVTAHHRDDQVETVLLRLFRGSSPEGLGGIPERSPDGWFVRPLLESSREEIEGYARLAGVVWREDASNADPQYRRNQLRIRLRELAGELNPGWDRAIADLAESQRRESEWAAQRLDALAGEWIQESDDGLVLKGEGWAQLPPAAARRLLRRAWHQVGGGRDVTRLHLDRARDFVASPGPGVRLQWPGGWVLERRRDGFHLSQSKPPEREAPGRRL